MAEPEYRAVPDAGLLRRLDSGLEVVRRQKHEWRSNLEGMDAEEFRRNTDKIRGSKFLRTWTLEEYVRWDRDASYCPRLG